MTQDAYELLPPSSYNYLKLFKKPCTMSISNTSKGDSNYITDKRTPVQMSRNICIY